MNILQIAPAASVVAHCCHKQHSTKTVKPVLSWVFYASNFNADFSIHATHKSTNLTLCLIEDVERIPLRRQCDN